MNPGPITGHHNHREETLPQKNMSPNPITGLHNQREDAPPQKKNTPNGQNHHVEDALPPTNLFLDSEKSISLVNEHPRVDVVLSAKNLEKKERKRLRHISVSKLFYFAYYQRCKPINFAENRTSITSTC